MALSDRLTSWLSAADRQTLPGLYSAVSVNPERVQRWLRGAGKPFVDPEAEARPDAWTLEQTAAWVTQQSRLRMTVLGGLAGLGGALGIPPEAAATMASGLRLAQRLAVVYGFDPRTDTGQMAVWQALAAGFQVELPESGAMGMRMSTVPRLVVGGVTRPEAAGTLATAVARQSAVWVGLRFTRFLPLPLLSSGLGARAAHRRVGDVGRRMGHTLSRLTAAPAPQRVIEAVEVDADG